MMAATYKWLIRVGKVAGAISFLFAAPYALVQYIQARDALRVEQTLSMFKMYNSAPFSGYREKVTKALAKNTAGIEESAKDVAKYKAFQFQLVRKEDIESELLLLLDFFDGVAVCIASQLCGKDTAIKLFKPRAADVYVNFYQYISAQRGGSTKPTFGVGLETIAKLQLKK